MFKFIQQYALQTGGKGCQYSKIARNKAIGGICKMMVVMLKEDLNLFQLVHHEPELVPFVVGGIECDT